VVSGTPSTTGQVGSAYSFTPSATDADGNTLTWSISGKPSWASFNSSTGQLSGTPTNVGTYSGIRISVSDGTVSVALASFSIAVSAAPAAANHPPTITGTPAAAAQTGTAYSFTPSANDVDNNTLSFSITNKPSWASFSIATGQLSGTPTATGTFSGIVISVSDGKATASLPSFTITVTAATSTNHPPTISGSPATSVTAGSTYNFTPTAADPDGNALTFSINTQPSWATFSTTTGKLSGTPTASDAGKTTSNIVISVSDGKATVSLAPFSITVNAAAAATGSATLSWTPPTTNADGSLLTDLAGFRIYYGTSSSNLSQSLTVADKTATSGTVTGLGTGTWYFDLKAYTTSGVESSASPVVSKTF
jgi:hypothetical protein